MNEVIFAFAIGVAFGALVVTVAICAAICAACRGKEPTSSASRSSEPSPRGEGFGTASRNEGDERLKKQWENFLNYDGTDKDQMSIGDE